MTAARLGAEQLWQWGGIDQSSTMALSPPRHYGSRRHSGPGRPVPNAATKAVLRAGSRRSRGSRSDRSRGRRALFDTKDLRGALDTFADKGPGHAVFAGH